MLLDNAGFFLLTLKVRLARSISEGFSYKIIHFKVSQHLNCWTSDKIGMLGPSIHDWFGPVALRTIAKKWKFRTQILDNMQNSTNIHARRRPSFILTRLADSNNNYGSGFVYIALI